ncbi:hypothetical protein EsH8_XIV_000032 [Colletotrichum jinshuiense]
MSASASAPSSTQPFSSGEGQRRRDQILSAYIDADRDTDTRLHPGNVDEDVDVAPQTVSRRDDTELSKVLEAASSNSFPEARIVLACASHLKRDKHFAVVPLPRHLGGWDVFGVVQRTQDVDFVIRLPFFNRPDMPASRALIPYHLDCNIFYDPSSDDCVIANNSFVDIFLAAPSSGTSPDRLSVGDSRVVTPGLWRILVWVDDDTVPEQHLVDFLILQRRFSAVTQQVSTASSSIKRLRPEDDGDKLGTKRQKKDGEVTEFIIAPATNPPPSSIDVGIPVKTNLSLTAGRLLATPTTALLRTSGTPLLSLSDGELAIVRTAETTCDTAQKWLAKPGSEGAIPEAPANYKLTRLRNVAHTLSARLFTARHSALEEDVVAKVLRYEGRPLESLAKCAINWKREMMFLSNLCHPNIISLKAFDGRLFAIYVEPLPLSLHRSIESPFGAEDATTIIRDTSAALGYLALKGIVHNDIKPANIAYSPQRGAVVLDFGLAMSTDEKTLPGGTPWYVPPDLITEGRRGLPGDIWALGITMLYVLKKIKLPEKSGKAWVIRNVLDRRGKDQKQMIEFLDQINPRNGTGHPSNRRD